MKHIQTVAGANIRKGAHTGCGECQNELPERVQNLLHRGKPILPEP